MTPETKQKVAKRLQDYPTESEDIVRQELKKKGYRFRFNEVLFGYIPDFYFPDHHKIVELDGRFHDSKKDKERDANFRKNGILTLRISSSRVFRALPQVLQAIEIFLGNKVAKPKPKKKKKVKPNKKRQVPPVLKGFITRR